MSAQQELEFKGYAMTDPSAWSTLTVTPFTPKTFGPDDVEIAITHCGVCGSDLHTLTGGWGATSRLPLVVGHEDVGKVTRVGANVTSLKPGDRAGVGAQVGSCLQCRACNDNYENYCPHMIHTYNHEHPDGVFTQGGYSTGIRAHERFVFPIPDALESRHAASMLCAGVTVFSPLKAYGAGPGKKVGVIGIGGLGHYAILFAKAMGAEVYAFTRGTGKAADARQMGADHVVDTTVNGYWKDLGMTFDILISTVDQFPAGVSIRQFLSMLYVHGKFISVGLPDVDQPLPAIHPFDVLANGSLVGGSHIGSKEDVLEMLALAAEKGVRPWIVELPMREAGRALEDVRAGRVRYRYVLEQDIVPVARAGL
ncbi:GroES-like protein [Trametes versicolor FP-101664 SS1]|uniref:GroES-like protein n=1 Tax=Trametes versicolor (strain FP-101664) TaxID=717944 RepID=UPI0004622D7B|nr:GroES-like protein [Trametes versicolor FP-101664 SS1]EIW58557.1 GroES-like protein [Trametes versicolor FP-101664 SS1]